MAKNPEKEIEKEIKCNTEKEIKWSDLENALNSALDYYIKTDDNIGIKIVKSKKQQIQQYKIHEAKMNDLDIVDEIKRIKAKIDELKELVDRLSLIIF